MTFVMQLILDKKTEAVQFDVFRYWVIQIHDDNYRLGLADYVLRWRLEGLCPRGCANFIRRKIMTITTHVLRNSLIFELSTKLRDYISRFLTLSRADRFTIESHFSLFIDRFTTRFWGFVYKEIIFMVSFSIFQNCFKVYLSSVIEESGEKCSHEFGNVVKSRSWRGSKISRLWMGGSQTLKSFE